MGEMAKTVIEDVQSENIIIKPGFYVAEWYRWLNSIQDWCVSRQLWWGHRIPAWRITSEHLNMSNIFV